MLVDVQFFNVVRKLVYNHTGLIQIGVGFFFAGEWRKDFGDV